MSKTQAMNVMPFKSARLRALLVAGVALFLAPTLPAASPPAQEARAFVQRTQTDLNRALRASKNPKADPALSAAFDKVLDYDHFTRATAGRHWDKLEPAQREEFSSLLKQLIQASYRRNLKSTADYKVEYQGVAPPVACRVGAGPCCVGAAPFWEGSLFVNTLASHQTNRRAEPVTINYAVGKSAGQWRVRDIVFGGVSLVCNYRRQFARFLRKGAFDELRNKMRARLDELNE